MNFILGSFGQPSRSPDRAPHLLTATILVPVRFALCEVGFHDVRVQFETETGPVGGLDVTILDDAILMDDDVVHPVPVTQHRLRCQKITDRAGPVRRRDGMDKAAGIVRCHRQREHLGQVGDPLGLQESSRVAQVRMEDVAALVDDEVLESLPPAQVFAGADGNLRACNQPPPALGVFNGIGSSSQSGRIGSTASAIWIDVRRSYSQ